MVKDGENHEMWWSWMCDGQMQVIRMMGWMSRWLTR